MSLINLIKMFYNIFTNQSKAWAIARALDRSINVTLNGTERETVSSRAYRGSLEGNRGWCILCKILDKLERDHCRKAFYSDNK
jgi:hypothetical protein